MKQLILVAVIAGLTATSAQAATVYEDKGLSFKIKGDWQVQLRQKAGDNKRAQVEFDDLEIKNSITYDLGSSLSAIGQLDFNFKDAAEDKQSGDDLEEAYLGIQYLETRVVVGKTDFATDEFGVEQAYELLSDEDQFDAQGSNGDDLIRVDTHLGAVDLVVSYEMEAEDESSENGEFLDIYVGAKFGSIKVAAAYQQKTATPTSRSEGTWGISAAVDAGVATLMADYSSSDRNTHDVDQYNLAAVIPIASSTQVAVGMVNTDDQSATDDVNEWYANVTYRFSSAKNVSVFAEIADADGTDINPGFLAGMQIRF